MTTAETALAMLDSHGVLIKKHASEFQSAARPMIIVDGV